MTKIDLEERKKIQLEILCNVHNFCVENNITYFLSSGTLIGAIRHKGYIPWDDDIDIAMPRPDYDRFFKIYSAPHYRAKNLDIDKDWINILGKVYDTRTVLKERFINYKEIGVNIDVLPLDGLPNNCMQRYFHLKKISCFTYLIGKKQFDPRYSCSRVKKIYNYLFRFILAFVSVEYLLVKKNRLIQKYAWDSSEMVSSLASGTERIPCKKIFFSSVERTLFEGSFFYIPIGYDSWLRLIFGNYMELPAVEERIPHHFVDAFWSHKEEI